MQSCVTPNLLIFFSELFIITTATKRISYINICIQTERIERNNNNNNNKKRANSININNTSLYTHI